MTNYYNSLFAGRDTATRKKEFDANGESPDASTGSKLSWLVSLFLMVLMLSGLNSFSQTTLLSPTGNGGFENGATPAANGWTAVNSTTDSWVVGNTPGIGSGTNCAFITSVPAGPFTWTYSQLSTIQHLYYDVTLPAGEPVVTMTFKWKALGEGTTTSDWDNLKIFWGASSAVGIPAANVGVSAAYQVSGPGAISGTYKLSSAAYNSETIVVTGVPGTTYRLVLSWKSDSSTIANPPASVDDISLVSRAQGNFISAATGNWSAPATWVGGVVPTPGDNATITNGHVVTIDAAGQGANNLTVGGGTSGTLAYGTVPTTFSVAGNLTVASGGLFNVFNGTIGKTLNVFGNIVNNGRVDTSVGATTAGQLTLVGNAVQTVSGTGSFGGTLSNLLSTNTAGVIRNLVFSNTSTATPNIVWSINNTRIAYNLTLTGARVNLGSNKMIFGNNGAGNSLTSPTGTGFMPGSRFSRYWTTSATGSLVTSGIDPSSTTSRYPFLSTTGVSRPFYITRSSSVTTGNTAGELTVVYNDATSTTTGLSVADAAYTINNRYDGNWTVTAEAGYVYASGTHTLAAIANTAYAAINGNSRIMLASAAAGGAHQAGTSTPGAQRISMSTAQITAGALYIGAAAADILPPCTTTIGGTVAPATISLCPTNIVTLTVTGSTSATVVGGLTYQWEVSPNGTTGWANATGTSNGVSYTTPAYVSGTQYYRRNTICLAGATSSSSTVATVGGPITPVTQSSNIVATTATTTSLTIGWAFGSGNNSSVYINTVNSFVNPSDGVSPGTANAVYTGSGQQLVYDGTAVSTTVTGLTTGTTYYVRVYEGQKCSTTAYLFNTTGVAVALSTADKLKYTIARATGAAYTPVSALATILTPTTGNSDDFTSAAINFFPFQYAGTTVSSFKACTNGWMTFNTALTSTTYPNALTGSTVANNMTLAPFWEDLLFNNTNVPNSQFLKYEVSGTTPNRVLTVQWENVEVFNYAGPSLNFQVKLYETTNVIEYVYGVMQGFDGTNPSNGTVTNGLAFNYTIGMNASTWAAPAAAGEAIGLQQANTTSFSSLYGLTANQGLNKLSVMPDCNSMLTFTPAATVRANDAAPSLPSAPSNDEPAGAIELTALLTTPANFCGSFYTSAFATATPSVAAPIATTVADDDVWFKFVANSIATTITLRGSGGYDAAMQLFASSDLNTVLASKNANALTGVSLTEVINAVDFPTVVGTEYMVRVYHAKGGATATATATVAAGAITAFTVTAPGSGYTSCYGGVGITSTPFVYITDATGTGAVGQLVVNATTGVVTGINMLTAGTGYSASPTVTIAPSGFGVTGDFSIIVNATPTPPANDEIAGAITLAVNAACTTVPGINISASASSQAVCSGNADDDVWYKFVATGSAPTVEVTGLTSFNAVVQIFSSSDNTAGGVLTSLYCQNNTAGGAAESVVTSGLIPGNTYFVRVYNNGTGAASGNFTICVYAPVPTCATALIPLAAATGVDRNPVLTWTASVGATSYDVYLDTVAGTTFSANVTTTTYTPVGLLPAATLHFWKVVPRNGNGPAVGCVAQSFTTGSIFSYCTPVYVTGKTVGDLISRVNIAGTTLNNITGTVATNPAYTYFTGSLAVTANMKAGNTYPVNVTVGTAGGQNMAAWIDYNNDGTFSATERIGFTTASIGANGSATFNVTVSCTAPLGLHRLRVRDVWNTTGNLISPCASYTYGETEDYTVNIIAPVACPAPSSLAVTTAATANTATIGWTIGCSETAWDVVYQLATLPAPSAASSLQGTLVTTNSLAITGLIPGTNYKAYVRAQCSASSYSVWASPVSFTTLNLAPGCTTLSSPVNGATGVALTGVVLTWTAPVANATQGVAASYDVFYGSTGPGSATTLLGNYTTTSVSLNLTGYNATFYVKVVAKNSGGSAVGCTETSFTTITDPFTPYCSAVSYTSGIEPITLVNFSNINNASGSAVGSGGNHQNFMSVVGNVYTSTSYTMTIKGNTDGPYTSALYVYIDWNHDNDFADAGEAFPAGSLFDSNGVDAIKAVSTIAIPDTATPGLTRMRIKKLFAGGATSDPCAGGGYGQTEEYTLNVSILNATLNATSCNATLPNIYNSINATWPLNGVTGYRFEVTDLTHPTNPVQTIDRTTHWFNLTQLATYDFSTTYAVRVQLKVGATWLTYYGAPCNVTTPDVALSGGAASIVSPACNSTLAAYNTQINSKVISGATGYRFRVTRTTPTGPEVQIYDTTSFWFRMAQLPLKYVYGTAYTIEVAIKGTGALASYSPFGPPCTINTPDAPSIAECGTTVASGQINASVLLNAVTAYEFEVTGPSGTQLINSPHAWFLSSSITGYSSATPYSIRVKVTNAQGTSPFGSSCTINPGLAARSGNAVSGISETTISGAEFKAVGYPNPFETNFTLNVTTTSDEKVQVVVYDMIGKQLESKEVNATDANALEVGANYPSGVYNVVVSQGANVKSLRMIKR
jgi:GEVED domain/Secretion system C-terminal sorting domain